MGMVLSLLLVRFQLQGQWCSENWGERKVSRKLGDVQLLYIVETSVVVQCLTLCAPNAGPTLEETRSHTLQLRPSAAKYINKSIVK